MKPEPELGADGTPWITLELDEPTTLAAIILGEPGWEFDFHAYRGVRDAEAEVD